MPDPAFPFLGVHFTRMIDGTVECGPNAVFSFKREGYNKTDFSISDSIDALDPIGASAGRRRTPAVGMSFYKSALRPSDPSDGRIRPLKRFLFFA